jgi:hypothetical protein
MICFGKAWSGVETTNGSPQVRIIMKCDPKVNISQSLACSEN